MLSPLFLSHICVHHAHHPDSLPYLIVPSSLHPPTYTHKRLLHYSNDTPPHGRKQLRAVRAFKSTLDEMEERRSIHSLRQSRSHPGPRPLYEISYIDEEGSIGAKTPIRDSPEPKSFASNPNSRSSASEKDRLLTRETLMERSRSAPFNNVSPDTSGMMMTGRKEYPKKKREREEVT